MTRSSRTLAWLTAVAIAALVPVASLPARADESSADPALTAAAQKAFKAIADGDVEALRPLVEKKYAKKLTADELRPAQTGPKVTVSYDGNVRVVRSDGKTAVVQA